jgi:uncharacterized membrane protein
VIAREAAVKGSGERSEFLATSGILALAASGCLLLYGVRAAITGKTAYGYLIWNLTLAMVPFVIAAAGSWWIGRAGEGRGRALIAAPVALLWLMFYPNAPYIFTDFIHVINRTYLRGRPPEWIGLNDLLWFDILMNAAFAFIGHFIGLASMWLVQSSLKKAWGILAARTLVMAAILLAGFGIYLGRFSRLNSWDLLLDPRRVFGEVAEASAQPSALLFSAAFSVFVLLSYASLVLFKRLGAAVDSRTPGPS